MNAPLIECLESRQLMSTAITATHWQTIAEAPATHGAKPIAHIHIVGAGSRNGVARGFASLIPNGNRDQHDSQSHARIATQKSASQHVTPKYVMSTLYNNVDGILDVSFSGGAGPGAVSWTSSPYRWRYGLWGGQGWSDGMENPKTYNPGGHYVDPMDGKFRAHDNAYTNAHGNAAKEHEADVTLIAGLKSLATTLDPALGTSVYDVDDPGAPRTATVTVNLELPGTFVPILYTFSMPFSEYARAQALAAFGVKSALFQILHFL